VANKIAGLALVGSMPLAAYYALTGAWRLGSLDPLTSMAVTHGALNLIFAIVGLLAPRPAPDWPRGASLSRLTSRGFVGGHWFERQGLVDRTRVATGTCDRIEEFANARFSPAKLAPEIRRFYERVADYRVEIVPTWAPGFRIGGRIWHAIASRMGQLALPVAAGRVRSRIVAIEHDGRPRPRAWIREDDGGRAMFVSAYSTANGYMNVAFPLPGAQMTSINRFENDGDGVLVTSRPDSAASDCGCWLVIRGVAIRLPFREEIRLRVVGDAIVGRQEMRLAGLRFLTVDYTIAREPDERRVAVAGDPPPSEP
jgi:hypothetical protein